MDAAALSILAEALNRRLAGDTAVSALLLPVPRRALLRLQSASDTSEEKDDIDFIIDLHPSHPAVWIEPFRHHPNPDPLAETLTDWLIGRTLLSIAAVPWDRTLTLRLSPQPSDDGGPGLLRCDLFGSTPRLVLLDENGNVQYRCPGGSDTGSPDHDPGPAESGVDADRIRFLDPLALESAPDAVKAELETGPPFQSSDIKFLTEYLTYTLKGCTDPMAREILHRAEESGILIKEVLQGLIKDFEQAQKAGPPNLHLYLPDESRRGESPPESPLGFLSPFELRHLSAPHLSDRHATGQAALGHREDEAILQAGRWGRHLEKRTVDQLLQQRRIQIMRSLQQSLTRLAKKLLEENKRGEATGSWRQWAQALLIHKQMIKRGSRMALLPDPMNPAEELMIPLDPTRNVPENADDYFRKAGREDRARPLREKRLACVEAVVTHLAMGEAVQGSRSWKRWLEQGDKLFPEAESKPPVTQDLRVKWQRLRSQLLPLLEAPGSQGPLEELTYRLLPASAEGRSPGGREGGRPASRRAGPKKTGAQRPESSGFHPRRFILAEGWIVLVGRSNQENDFLTHHLARSDDLWFHADHAAGSHVVLQRAGRKDNPSIRAMEEAASIAARYSKAHHSGKVPVTYTLKKFVRKPRKAPAGLALCTQTKTILVSPATEDWLKEHQAADSASKPGSSDPSSTTRFPGRQL
ncbi:MAG: DUF814 domain-containing protein [Candidatus Eisenbacteria bacterium]|uniref:DUF814 domain-containing protein n=1 Tax=Eiseniibacteriota bacterium TaxID=2212470 RepID=A0A948RR75_UNCEI|nr:DUF814 domain-containing protein [Candidatus Eisenbacteria bacterium]MBU1949701.1 DUF814 domain-containing protein [Candidatus Eisenbacteria bacterium]MBU2689523.1 DUF814 domain-containing protein [Candidatus Eisenbacteria bacterium]